MTHANITNELIIDLNDASISAIELCTRHGLSIAQLHDIITSPEFVQLQRMLATIERARDTFRLASVTQVLERIALDEPTSPAHAETIRKAAAHLDRHLRKNSTKTDDPTPEPVPDTAALDDPQHAPQSPQGDELTPPASPRSDHAEITTNHPHAPTTRPSPNAPP